MSIDKPPHRVVAAVVRQNGKFLICQRPLQKLYGGQWEFPGGKVEGSESALETVNRELAEELGVKVSACGGVLFIHRDKLSNTEIEFRFVQIQGIPQTFEHLRIEWVADVQLQSFDLLPGDREFVSSVLAGRK